MSRFAVLPFALVVSRVGSVHDEVHPGGCCQLWVGFPMWAKPQHRSHPDWAMDS
jgi:hypothetical protein